MNRGHDDLKLPAAKNTHGHGLDEYKAIHCIATCPVLSNTLRVPQLLRPELPKMEGPVGLIIYSDIDEVVYITEGCIILNITFEICIFDGLFFMFLFNFDDFGFVERISAMNGHLYSVASFV